MAYTFDVSSIPATGARAIYTLIATLMTAGWTKVQDSDGTTYSAGGTQVTSGASGANGLGNSLAWVRMRAPAVNGGLIVNQQREITFQRGNVNDRGWRIKYSASAGFVIGAPAAAVTPEAADEVYMIGGGTDAAPTFLALWMPVDGAYRWHVCCGGSSEFYSFYAYSVTSGSTSCQTGMCLDAMASGSFPATDVDPAVMYVSDIQASSLGYGVQLTFGHLGGAIANTTNPAHARAWLGVTSAAKAATAGTNSQRIGMIPYGSTSGVTLGGVVTAGSNAFTAKDDLLPAWWIRPGASVAPAGVKGCSTLFRYGSIQRTTQDTCDVLSTRDQIFIAGTAGANTQCIWQPWNGSIPVI